MIFINLIIDDGHYKKKIIKLSKSSISNVEVNSVKKVLDKEYLGMGPEVKKV